MSKSLQTEPIIIKTNSSHRSGVSCLFFNALAGQEKNIPKDDKSFGMFFLNVFIHEQKVLL